MTGLWYILGNVIPLDGVVVSGEAMINQASLTGESEPVRKDLDSYVYAGTVLEEGELVIRVKQISGTTRFEKIVTMIEESEKLKSSLEGKAEHLADALVPYTFAGTAFDLSCDKECDQSFIGPYGGFFLCFETCYAVRFFLQ